MSDSPIRGVHHLAMVTNDLDRTTRFYCDALGLELVATTGNRSDLYPFRHYFFRLGPQTTIATQPIAVIRRRPNTSER